jgi:hypothetical protein
MEFRRKARNPILSEEESLKPAIYIRALALCIAGRRNTINRESWFKSNL